MVFSSSLKGRCFGLDLGLVLVLVLGLGLFFFSFSNPLLPAFTSRNVINLNMIWICLEGFFHQFRKVGVLVGFGLGLDVGVGFGFGFGFFHFLTPYSSL